MIIIIQCAGAKQPTAGHIQQKDGTPVSIVADPAIAPADPSCHYAHPDDLADTGISWRDELVRYNAAPGDNPLGLLPAWELYKNPTYKLLAEHFTTENLYILSAGWGMIRADFLTPYYDITFSSSGPPHTRRPGPRPFHDLQMLPSDVAEPVVLFAGKDYTSFACELLEGMRVSKYLFYSSADKPDAPGWHLLRYPKSYTNWHYQCAKDLVDGSITL